MQHFEDQVRPHECGLQERLHKQRFVAAEFFETRGWDVENGCRPHGGDVMRSREVRKNREVPECMASPDVGSENEPAICVIYPRLCSPVCDDRDTVMFVAAAMNKLAIREHAAPRHCAKEGNTLGRQEVEIWRGLELRKIEHV